MSSGSEYLVGPLIGEGSFGHVLFCIHKSTLRHVAIKVVTKHSIGRHLPDKRLLHSVLTERRVLEELRSCDHVVNLLAGFHDDQCLYFVMECIEGGTLHDLFQNLLSTWSQPQPTTALHSVVGETIPHSFRETNVSADDATNFGMPSRHRKGNWDESAIGFYVWQCVTAIESIHSPPYSVIHGDIKPENILLTPGGVVKLTDFGSAIEMSVAGTEYRAFETAPGTTPHAAPTTTIVGTMGIPESGVCSLAPPHAEQRSTIRRSVAPLEVSASIAGDSTIPLREPRQQARHFFRGTTEYSSPEVLRGVGVCCLSPGIDLWSLGCIIYSMWNWGDKFRSPFFDLSDMSMLNNILQYCDVERERLSKPALAAGHTAHGPEPSEVTEKDQLDFSVSAKEGSSCGYACRMEKFSWKPIAVQS
jgi:serine/threonine protein kinase